MLIFCNIFVKLEHFILFSYFDKYMYNFIYYMININLIVNRQFISTCSHVASTTLAPVSTQFHSPVSTFSSFISLPLPSKKTEKIQFPIVQSIHCLSDTSALQKRRRFNRAMFLTHFCTFTRSLLLPYSLAGSVVPRGGGGGGGGGHFHYWRWWGRRVAGQG